MKKLSQFQRLHSGLEASLAHNHACLTENNPVLMAGHAGLLSREQAAAAIGQYYFLVLEIVALLTITKDRLADWPKVGAELTRNIGEEEGSRTQGLAHRDILKRCLKRELGFTGLGRYRSPATSTFLNCFKTALLDQEPAYAAGMVYALEAASANPELEILAKILNAYGQLAGLGHVVDEAAWQTNQLAAIRAKHARSYTLTEFIYIHLVDFEKGHKSGLWKALSSRPWTEAECAEFARGFEQCLNLMDTWWMGLARNH